MSKNILFVSANPSSTAKLDLADELRRFQHGLQGHDVEVMLLPAAQPDDLARAMATTDFDVVHFSGHAQDEGILMRNAAGNEELVSVNKLSELFEKYGGKTKLAFLNACDTKNIATAIEGSVGMAIGTNEKLDDVAAKVMTQVFYTALGKGNSLEAAYEEATAALNTHFPEKNVYKNFCGKQDQKLLACASSDGAEVKVAGLPSWDKHFHISHLEKQIGALEHQIELNQKILKALLGIGGVLLFYLLYLASPISWSVLFPLSKDSVTMLIGQKPLFEWLTTVGAAIPIFIASFKQRFLLNGNEELRLKKQLLETVRSSNRMSEKLQNRLHAIMEQSVRGANPE